MVSDFSFLVESDLSFLVESDLSFWMESEVSFLVSVMTCFWAQRAGCLRGLKVRNPVENMWVSWYLDLSSIDDEPAVEATAQLSSPLLTSFTSHPSSLSACLLIEGGRTILNSPRSLVLVSFLNFFDSPSAHSTATVAPKTQKAPISPNAWGGTNMIQKHWQKR